MKRTPILILSLATVVASLAIAAKSHSNPFTPGARTMMLAHNAYPDDGKYGDRLDRAISAGVPFVVEEDLIWVNGKSLLIHNEKFANADSPTLESYFFPKVTPIIEKALNEGNKKGDWPLITLYLDIKNDPEEHLAEINKVLDKHDAWLTKAVKTADITKQSPLELKPMMVILEDKQHDIKQAVFYDRIPVGGKFRAFGSAVKFNDNPNKLARAQRAERLAGLLKIQPEQLVSKHADNWRRWFGTDWNFIETCGPKHGEWTPATEARMKHFVEYGHSLGYVVSFYEVNGFSEDQNQGWTTEYNFGSRQAALVRWNALIAAHADFIATDQYEDVAEVIRGKH